jgi:hypothetical protein
VAGEAGIVSIQFADARQLADALRSQGVLIKT